MHLGILELHGGLVMGNTVTTIIFVRHAQSLHPYSDDRTRPLTKAGVKDLQIVMDTLKDRHIDAF